MYSIAFNSKKAKIVFYGRRVERKEAGGGGNFHIERTGMLVGNFEKKIP